MQKSHLLVFTRADISRYAPCLGLNRAVLGCKCRSAVVLAAAPSKPPGTNRATAPPTRLSEGPGGLRCVYVAPPAGMDLLRRQLGRRSACFGSVRRLDRFLAGFWRPFNGAAPGTDASARRASPTPAPADASFPLQLRLCRLRKHRRVTETGL